jgi:hypothetical protein
MKFVKQAEVESSIYRPGETLGFQEVEASRISRQSAYEGATAGFTLMETSLVLIRVGELSRPQGHRAAGIIKSMKNPYYPNGNRTRTPLACSAAPKPTAPHVVIKILSNTNFIHGALLLSFPFSSFV